MRKHITSSLATLLLLSAGIGVAQAATEYKDGGTWDQGSSGGMVWSYYKHDGVGHGASVRGKQYVDSGCQPPGTWARAISESRTLRSDGSYYRHC
ncbi:MAG: lactococcin 972 family bacteriocin [Corynebacterium sp.]|nr:lactococcin 972 family bacteriocin [Corynebacterium sp.]